MLNPVVQPAGRPFTVFPSIVRPLTTISRDALSPHLVEGLQ